MAPERDQRLAATVAQRRGARGWSADELARRAGVSPKTIQNVEDGLLPNTANLKAIAQALETSVGVNRLTPHLRAV